MAHFAKLDENNIVTEVHVVNNDDILNLPFPASEPYGIEFLREWSGGYSLWRQTSYNNNFRKKYAGIGDTYDPQRDAFIPPKTYPSWILNEESCMWEPPVAYPDDGQMYLWNEETTSWEIYDEQV